jgi:hypothetical protein
MNGKYWIQGKYTGRYFIDGFGNRLEIYWADAVQLVNDHPEFEMIEVDDSYTPKEVKLSGPDAIQLDMFAIQEVEV